MNTNVKNSLLMFGAGANIELLLSILNPELAIYTAKSGDSVLEIIKKSLPDIIILDITAPDTNGFEILAELKSSEATRHIPVITIAEPDSVRDNSRQLPHARVLVVDDVEINLEVAKGMMHPYSMQMDCVSSGQEAIDAIRDEKQRYNAIFMDHVMPEMDGVEAVRFIREEIGTKYAKTIPIIALTADSGAENEKMFLSKGFQAFLPKPIEPELLDAIIRKWVRDKTPEITGNIEGLDINKGRERFGGDMNLYLQVLRSFTSNTRGLIEKIKKVNKDNLKEYAITVHGIKGSCWGIWAETAGERAETLEKAAKAGDMDFIAANNEGFIEILLKLLAAIEDAIYYETPVQDKLKKTKPEREALAKLLEACENYNINEISALIAEIDKFEYESDSGLADWLRENADQMNYSEIVERLNTWLKET